MAVKAGAALVALLATLPLVADLPGRVGLAACALAAAGRSWPPTCGSGAAPASGGAQSKRSSPTSSICCAWPSRPDSRPARALAEVGRRHPGMLAAELHRAAHAVALGVPAADALTQLERRCPAAGIAPLGATLRRAARHGAPLGPALEAQAAEARSRCARAHAERAARAAPQVQLVVALLLVPRCCCSWPRR